MERDRKASLAASMDDHLSKPFSLAGLRAVLERWLPASALRAGLPAEARSPSETRSAKEGSAAAGPAIELDSGPAARLDPSRLNAVASPKSRGPGPGRRCSIGKQPRRLYSSSVKPTFSVTCQCSILPPATLPRASTIWNQWMLRSVFEARAIAVWTASSIDFDDEPASSTSL